MINKHTLAPDEFIRLNTGQVGKYLIIRQCSGSIMVRGDNLRPTALERGDVVDVTSYEVLELLNNQIKPVTIEYQMSDLLISTKMQRVDIDNAVTISEILAPVTINKIIEPLTVSEIVKPITVEAITEPVTVNEISQPVEIGNFPDVQKTLPHKSELVFHTLGKLTETTEIATNTARHELMVRASADNSNVVTLSGFPLNAGEGMIINHGAKVTIEITSGDIVHASEVVEV